MERKDIRIPRYEFRKGYESKLDNGTAVLNEGNQG